MNRVLLAIPVLLVLGLGAVLADEAVKVAAPATPTVPGTHEVKLSTVEREAIHGINVEEQALMDGVMTQVRASPQWKALEDRAAAIFSETLAAHTIKPEAVHHYDAAKGVLVVIDAAPVTTKAP